MFTCWLQTYRRVHGECVFSLEQREYSDCSNKAMITIRLLHAITNNNNNKAEIDCDFTLLYTCLQPTGTPPPTIFRFTEPNRTEEMKYHKLLIERQHKICTDNPKSSVFSKASTGLGLAPAYLASVTLYIAACSLSLPTIPCYPQSSSH